MKKINFIILLASFINLNAQVGINTDNPQRTLDINGNFGIRSTEYKANDSKYNRVLSTNKDGDIEYWTKESILDKMTDGVLENKLLYFGTTPTGDLIVPCGRFEIRFAPKISNSNTVSESNDTISDTPPQIRLKKAPTADTDVYFSRIRKIYDNNNSFANSGRTLRTNSKITFTTSNEWKSIGLVPDLSNTAAGKGYKINTLDEYYISYPGLPNTYRISFLARTMTQPSETATNSYTMICEKF